jgi:ribonuclease HII
MLLDRYKQDDLTEAGIDEAGRGSLWGPLVAAAVVWPDQSTWTEEIRAVSEKIKDSKKITERGRERLREAIFKYAVDWSIGFVEPDEIDSLGMTKTNQLAFQRAVEGLIEPPGRLLIDGCLSLPLWEGEQVVEPQADNKYIAVGAASILAKTERDGWVVDYCKDQPELDEFYRLSSNKGYGAKVHMDGIVKHGMHPLHRRLFLRRLACQIDDSI